MFGGKKGVKCQNEKDAWPWVPDICVVLCGVGTFKVGLSLLFSSMTFIASNAAMLDIF